MVTAVIISEKHIVPCRRRQKEVDTVSRKQRAGCRDPRVLGAPLRTQAPRCGPGRGRMAKRGRPCTSHGLTPCGGSDTFSSGVFLIQVTRFIRHDVRTHRVLCDGVAMPGSESPRHGWLWFTPWAALLASHQAPRAGQRAPLWLVGRVEPSPEVPGSPGGESASPGPDSGTTALCAYLPSGSLCSSSAHFSSGPCSCS